MARVILDRLYLFAGYAAGGFLLAIFVLMMLLSAGRPLGLNIPAGDDFVSWCMVATPFLGLAHTFRHGEMIRVGLLIHRLEGRTRHYVEIAALLTFDSWRFHDMAQGVLPVPLWIPQLGYSGGLLILLIAFIDELINVLRGNPPRSEKPKPQTAEEVVEQAIQSG